jgi:hypothetical protein
MVGFDGNGIAVSSPVINGRWALTINPQAPSSLISGGLQTGTYTFQLTDLDNASHTVLATATLTVTASGSVSLSASPPSGPAPLTVTFSGGGNGGGNPNDGPFINFGDTSAQVQMECGAVASGGGCAYPYSITHTYTSAGTYQAQIDSQATGNVIGSASVTVTQ